MTLTRDQMRAKLTDEVIERLYASAHKGRTGCIPALRDIILDALAPPAAETPQPGDAAPPTMVFTCPRCGATIQFFEARAEGRKE